MKKGSMRKKRTLKKRVIRNTVPLGVKKYVKKILAKNIEDQVLISSQTLSQSTLRTNGGYALIKPTSQGDVQAGHSGWKIKLKNINVKGIITLNPYNAISNYASPIMIRMFIYSTKVVRDQSTNDTFSGDLFRIQTGTSGTNNNSLDMLYPINDTDYKVHYQKQFTLCNPTGANGFPASTISGEGQAIGRFNINCAKWVNKYLKYSNDSGTLPNNANLYIGFLGCYADGSTSTAQNSFIITMFHQMVYNDI